MGRAANQNASRGHGAMGTSVEVCRLARTHKHSGDLGGPFLWYCSIPLAHILRLPLMTARHDTIPIYMICRIGGSSVHPYSMGIVGWDGRFERKRKEEYKNKGISQMMKFAALMWVRFPCRYFTLV